LIFLRTGQFSGTSTTKVAIPIYLVIAAVRNPMYLTAQALQNLPMGPNSHLIVVKLDASIEQGAHDAVASLQHDYGIQHLDIVIANAGVVYFYPTIAEVMIADIRNYMELNVYGVVGWVISLSLKEPKILIL
jgi:NADP-dependent 3-hydroxy acid dehydrogenase YdfG